MPSSVRRSLQHFEGRETTDRRTNKVASPVRPRGYVASKRSQVFHRADCKSAAKISEKNLVRYNTRDEAIQAGKKPCVECRP